MRDRINKLLGMLEGQNRLYDCEENFVVDANDICDVLHECMPPKIVGDWNGYPLNPHKDSDGHVLRVDGCIDIYSWDAASQWWTDPKGRWVSPNEVVRDCDTYIGQLRQ